MSARHLRRNAAAEAPERRDRPPRRPQAQEAAEPDTRDAPASLAATLSARRCVHRALDAGGQAPTGASLRPDRRTRTVWLLRRDEGPAVRSPRRQPHVRVDRAVLSAAAEL